MPHRPLVVPPECASMLFNHKTSYRTDYRGFEITNVIRTVFKPKPVKPRPLPEPLKDIQALFPLRDPSVPFDMFHKPKEIVKTNPRIMQDKHERPEDTLRLHVQQTRPEVVMTPALHLDAVGEPMRQKFMDHIYKSTQMVALEEAVALSVKRPNVKAPLTNSYGTPSPEVSIEPLQLPYVSPEWRMQSVTWETNQLRSYVEPTKTFWKSRTPNCPECKETAARKAMQKMARMKRN